MRIDYASFGRVLYGLAVSGLGVISLVYRDFVDSLQRVPASLPGYRPLAVVTAIVLVLAGLAIVTRIKMRIASLVLVALFVSWVVLLHIPDAFANPVTLRSPFWIRAFESLGLAGAALILAGQASDPVREQWLGAGRIVFGVSLPVFGVLHLIYPENVGALVGTAIVPYPWPVFWAYLTGAGHIAAGVAIASGVIARWAAIAAGFMYASWALTLHVPRVVGDLPPRSAEFPAGYGGDRGELTSLCVCFAFWAAAWIVAGSLHRQRVQQG